MVFSVDFPGTSNLDKWMHSSSGWFNFSVFSQSMWVVLLNVHALQQMVSVPCPCCVYFLFFLSPDFKYVWVSVAASFLLVTCLNLSLFHLRFTFKIRPSCYCQKTVLMLAHVCVFLFLIWARDGWCVFLCTVKISHHQTSTLVHLTVPCSYTCYCTRFFSLLLPVVKSCSLIKYV